MSFVCGDCNKMFTRKANLEYHVEKNACKKQDYECKLCGIGFTTKTSMYRHIRISCKVKKEDDIEKNSIYEKLIKIQEDNEKIKKTVLEDNEKLRKQMIKNNKKYQDDKKELKKQLDDMKKLIKKDGKNTTINTGDVNNGTIHNGDNYNIILVGYGHEDISKIDKKELLKAIQSGYDSTLKLAETMHFNPKHPEYHNVYIPNMKDKYAMMFDGKDWNLTMKDDLINKIYDDKKNYIEENIDDFVESMTVSRKKALDRWLETDDEDERILKVKNEIKLLLYNKRNVIIDKHSNTKKQKTIKKCVKDIE